MQSPGSPVLRRVIRCISLLALGASAVLSAAPAAAAPVVDSKRVHTFKPDKGFVDSAMSFDQASQRLAYIHADSAQFMKLLLVDLPTSKVVATIEVKNPALVPRALTFSPSGKHIIFVWTDGEKGTQGAHLYEIATGKLVREVGPYTRVHVLTYDGELSVAAATIVDTKGGGQTYRVSVLRGEDLKERAQAQVVLRPDRTLVVRDNLRLLYFEPGHLTLIGMKRGDYDRKRDIRLPEEAVRYDVIKRKAIWNEAPKEVVEWAKATEMRPKHPDAYRFLQVANDLKSLQYVDRDNHLATLGTPVKWLLYEPKSLVQDETVDGSQLYFSLTIDPVNVEAVARKKADLERMDLYRLDPGPKAVPLGRVHTQKRRFSWTVGGGYFAYLYKLKGFGRGGKELAVFRCD